MTVDALAAGAEIYAAQTKAMGEHCIYVYDLAKCVAYDQDTHEFAVECASRDGKTEIVPVSAASSCKARARRWLPTRWRRRHVRRSS